MRPEAVRLVKLFVASRRLGAQPLAGSLLDWPARLVDAFEVLENERDAIRLYELKEAQRKARQSRGQ